MGFDIEKNFLLFALFNNWWTTATPTTKDKLDCKSKDKTAIDKKLLTQAKYYN